MSKYTQEQINFLKENIKGTPYKELFRMFNEKFGTNYTFGQLKGCLSSNKLRNGIDMTFAKGGAVHRGSIKKGQPIGIETRFKKGQRPKNYKPVGSERIDRDGYLLVKVSDEGSWNQRWRHKHKFLWEKENGPIPKGHCLLFADGNKQNIDLNNLILIKQSQLLIINKQKLIYDDPELTKTGVIISKVIDQTNKKVRKKKG